MAIPHAGGGPSSTLPLAEALAPEIEVWSAQLPGRERRYDQPAADSIAAVAEPLAIAMADHVPPPYALFGHSMGALIAFEVARRLADIHAAAPVRLVVSAHAAPHLPRAGTHRHLLDDEELLAWLGDVGGVPEPVLRDGDLMRLLLPTLRTDLRACETYTFRSGPPLGCPITALTGMTDPQASVDDVAAWSRHTSADFEFRPLPGGHFYQLDDGWPAFVGELRTALAGAATPHAVTTGGGAGGIVDLITRQAARTPAAVAVRDATARWSYRELLDRAYRWSAALRAAGVRPGQVVPVYADRSIELPAALIGVLLAGAAFLPLDPAYPAERLGYMLADSGASVVVTEPGLLDRLPGSGRPLVTVTVADLPTTAPRDGGQHRPDAAPAYLLYTSGSTGAPKGTLVPHRALVRLCTDFAPRLGLTGSDVVLAQTPLSFDISLVELLLPLTVGASVHLVGRRVATDGEELSAEIQRAGVTFVQGTPTTLRMLVAAGWSGGPRVTVLSGGEALPRDLADQLTTRSRALWNGYGPTETAVYSVAERVGPGPVTIGVPLDGERAYLLDERGDPVPDGSTGELHLGGDGLAHGYLGRPALTAERFVPDPFAPRPGARMYRTGDLARRRPDGRIEYLGRLDHQIKLRGHRIEPGEIESALRGHPGVRDAVAALAARDGDGEPLLCAYLLLDGPGSGDPGDHARPDREELRRHLRRTLPDFMVPARFLVLDTFPLTPSGKVDRGRLGGGTPLAGPGHEPCRSAIEQVLVGLWLDLIEVEELGVTESVFAAGADSLLAMRAAAMLREIFRAPVAVRDLFELTTVREQAARLAGDNPAAEGIADRLVRLVAAGTGEG
ncbi:amino acid adenylation domain-containing protein [Micromonospora sp. NPDC126480]|uniref:amino acid adenylation domain-containing protein n=1 Tax=Micromonospora sp. NPDC126480 TaxID=3155312 RepID=UPI00331B1761